MSQLRELATPIPQKFIGKSDKGMDAADHTVINQLLLRNLGPFSFSVVHVLRSEVPDFKTKGGKTYPGGLFVTGAVCRLTAVVDGREVSIEEAGGCENAALKDGDGERLKHATTDALKRCAMRLGLGLHIWAQQMYFLDKQLDKDAGATVTHINPEVEAAVARHPASLTKTGEAVDEETGEIVDVVEPAPAKPAAVEGPSPAQTKALHASLAEAFAFPADTKDKTDKINTARYTLLADKYGVESSKDLTSEQVSELIDACKKVPHKVRERAGLPQHWALPEDAA